MSDQSPPSKPKPGSLRDRIAAFEKSASTPSAPVPAPAVRPKPAGFSSWKPKQPSPPSSPSAASTEHAALSTGKPGGMSASDAKESITKAGSLKDRMAALQGKGAFGAPPPVAPKPALEKPKWKPPPAVHAPRDDDDHSGGGSSAAIEAAVERTTSPPVSVKSPESVDTPKAVEEGGEPEAHATTAEGDNGEEPAVLDPEEEERQRRAAIAARMARLGGARLGMAPPVFGRKPPVRRPTQEEVAKTEEPKAIEEPAKTDVSSPDVVKSSEEQLSPPTEPSLVASPPIEVPANVHTESGVGKSAEYFPVRKDSENASILSSESVDSHPSRSPSSMPVPVVPRRAGPPRKKPVKPAPPPEVPEEKAEESTPASVAVEDVSGPEAGLAAAPGVVASPEHEDVKTEITEDATQPPVPEPLQPADHEITDEPVAEDETAVADRTDTASKLASPQLEPPSTSEKTESEETEIVSPVSPTGLAYDDDVERDHEGDEPKAADVQPPVLPSPPLSSSRPNLANIEAGIIEPNSTPVTGIVHDESEEAEEEARKKRVADRIAKMGGINPFAPPPPPHVKSPSEGPHSPPSVSATFVPSPPLAPVPIRKQSIQLEPLSPPPEDVHTEPKGNVVESTAEEEEVAFDEDEEYADEVNDEPTSTSTSTSEVDKPVTPPLPHSESHRQSATFPSRPPPIPPSSTRPPVQVQQYDEEDDDGSDYGDEESAEDTPPAGPLRPPNPGHPSTLSAIPSEDVNTPPLPPARPAQPPRRIIPQAPEPPDEDEEGEDEDEETDEEADERMATSQLFVPPPSGRGPIAIPRHAQVETEDGDGSENDVPALPVLHRRSLELLGRAVPPPPLPVHPPAVDEDSEPESDHDGEALPIPPPPPPRHTGGPPPRSVPMPPPPPPPQVLAQIAAATVAVQPPPPPPPPVLRTVPLTSRLDVDHSPTSPEHLTPTVSISESDEILDEEEGDPIDPSFHSPSRRGSAVNLFATAQAQAQAEVTTPVQVPPPPPVGHTSREPSEQAQEQEQEQDSEQLRRRTIAERMAKLGGIKFGGAPMPVPAGRPIPPPRRADDEQEESHSELAAEEQPDALSEEEEERARKERIAAKMAGMGGMRIGMMPMGMGALPQRSHVLREENVVRSPTLPVSPPALVQPPRRAVPPARPPPPPAVAAQGPDTDSDYGSAEDGVKVEAEESEMEEVGYEDAVEQPDEAPPPVPSRGGRAPPRRESSDYKPMSPSMPPVPSPRPPVPSAMPNRRSSVQTSRSTGSTDAGMSPPQRKTTSSYIPQSEYVMVEEPEGQEAPPPPPPARPVSRVPPTRPVLPTTDTQDSISTQWELPSIPTSSIDFGGGTDLSLSWTDAGAESALPTSPPPPPPPSKKPSLPPAVERQLSADDLIGLWGRVGVQVCESATTLFEKSKRTLIGDGTYAGFVQAVLATVPNAASAPTASGGYGYVIYVQNGPSVQKRVSEIMPGDIVEIHDAKLKGHKGIQTYHQNVGGAGEVLVGIVGEFEAKKSKIKVFQANQHVGQQTVESVSYRLEDLKSGIVKVYRVMDA